MLTHVAEDIQYTDGNNLQCIYRIYWVQIINFKMWGYINHYQLLVPQQFVRLTL